ncbi:MAG: alanine racemase [Elusimicrobia bacterium]|nr:alanine racemase [Elusimicrobiota bacterium]
MRLLRRSAPRNDYSSQPLSNPRSTLHAPRCQKWIEVDLDELAENAKKIKKEAGAGVKFLAIVKSNAYGHGLETISRKLANEKLCDALGVWSLAEAKRVLDASLGRMPQVSVLTPALEPAETLLPLIKKKTWLNLDRPELIKTYGQAAQKAKSRAQIFLDLDFGLGRWGCPPREALSLAKEILNQKWLDLTGVSTHIDYVPGLHRTEAENKLKTFRATANALEGLAQKKLIKTCANTSVFLDFPEWRLDMARIGNLLYGINPTKTPFPVKNIWSFKAKILMTKKIRQGETVGYGNEFLAAQPMRIGSVAVGFGDGLTMEPAHNFIGLVSARRYWAKAGTKELAIIGRAGLGHALLDLTHAPELQAGDIVELPVRRTAASMDVPRIYKK